MVEFILSMLELKAVRYFISAAIATLMDIIVYYFLFNYFFDKQDIPVFNSFVLSAPTASLMASYSTGLVTNFLITRFYVFTESDLKAHHQFFRFTLVALVVLVLNYGLMTLLIKQFYWFPTIARAFSAITIGAFSFFTHKFFTFKVSKAEVE